TVVCKLRFGFLGSDSWPASIKYPGKGLGRSDGFTPGDGRQCQYCGRVGCIGEVVNRTIDEQHGRDQLADQVEPFRITQGRVCLDIDVLRSGPGNARLNAYHPYRYRVRSPVRYVGYSNPGT